jgi:hypothetical protein
MAGAGYERLRAVVGLLTLVNTTEILSKATIKSQKCKKRSQFCSRRPGMVTKDRPNPDLIAAHSGISKALIEKSGE